VIGLSSDAWAVWLVVQREGKVSTDAHLAQHSGIGRRGQGTTPRQRGRVADALAELEDAGYLERDGGDYTIHDPAVA
jgi:hypothetical protein